MEKNKSSRERRHYLNTSPRRRGIRTFFRAYRMEVRQNKRTFAVYTLLRALIILCIIREFMRGNYESVFMAALTLCVLTIPTILQIQLKVEIPQTLEIIILLFIYSAEILGEINEYYTKIPFWDTILHTLNGFLAAAVGFSLVLLLNKRESVIFELSPLYIAIVAFCFSMTIGVCWEFIEFSMDHLFHLDMQKDTIVHMISSTRLNPHGQKPVKIYHIHSVTVNGKNLGLGGYLDLGLIDTMKDLFVNFIGALVFSIIGFFALHGQKEPARISNRFLIRRKKEDTDFLAQADDLENLNRALAEMDEKYDVDERLQRKKKRLEEREILLREWEQDLREREMHSISSRIVRPDDGRTEQPPHKRKP